MTPPGLGASLRSLACTFGGHQLARTLHRKKLLVVMYHGVTHDPKVAGRWWHHVLVADFARQLAYLRKHYQIVPLDDALSTLWNGGLEHPTACITFDDGYRNNLTVALPELQRFQAPATIYIATGMIGTERRLWTVELDHAFTATKVTQIDLAVLGLGRVTLHGPDHRIIFKRVLNTVKEVSFTDRPRVLQTIFDQLKAPEDPATHEPFVMMDWNEAQELADSGLVTFGGHTVNHEIVSRLPDQNVKTEIGESIASVEANVSAVSRTFAYPNGGRDDFDARAIAAVQQAGCIGAVTTIEGLCGAEADHFQIQRIGVGSDTSFDQFRLLTSGLISDIKHLSLKVPGRTDGQ